MVNGDKQTFIIDIKDMQNETWQGSLSWVQGKKKKSFRSMLELIKLINSAIDNDVDKEEKNN